MAYEWNAESPSDSGSGLYYVQERGILLAPAGYQPTCHSTDNFEIALPTASTTLLSSWTLNKSGFHDAPSLMTLCIDFIAEHIETVESLVDFPEVVGQALFKAVKRKGKFVDCTDHTLGVLNLFSQAYAGAVLDQLNLSSSQSLLTKLLEFPSLWTALKMLDLRYCCFGDDSDVFPLASQLNSLTHLSLKGCSLTDKALQRLTAPMRMFTRGSLQLKVFDLSCNPKLGDAVVRYLLCYKHLKALNLSNTMISNLGIKKILQSSQMKKVQKCEHFKDKSDCSPDGSMENGSCICSTHGWAEDIITRWCSKHSSGHKTNSHAPSGSSRASKFYGKSKTRARLLDIVETPIGLSSVSHLIFEVPSAIYNLNVPEKSRGVIEEITVKNQRPVLVESFSQQSKAIVQADSANCRLSQPHKRRKITIVPAPTVYQIESFVNKESISNSGRCNKDNKDYIDQGQNRQLVKSQPENMDFLLGYMEPWQKQQTKGSLLNAVDSYKW